MSIWFDDILLRTSTLRKPETLDDLFDDIEAQRHWTMKLKPSNHERYLSIREKQESNDFRWNTHHNAILNKNSGPGRTSLFQIRIMAPWPVLNSQSKKPSKWKERYSDIYLPRRSESDQYHYHNSLWCRRESPISDLTMKNFRECFHQDILMGFDWRKITTLFVVQKIENNVRTPGIRISENMLSPCQPWGWCTKRIEREYTYMLRSHQAKSQLFVRSTFRHLWPGSWVQNIQPMLMGNKCLQPRVPVCG